MRALISTAGTARSPISLSRLGQNSDSTHSTRSGRQWSRKRRTQPIRSTGWYWCRTPAGSRLAMMPAEVTVPVVTSSDNPGRSCISRSIRDSMESDSPTLAA